VSLLFDLGGAGRQLTAAEMPADMQVCNCNGVSKGTIAACFAGGMRDAPGVMNATRAGKGCGSCKGLVGEIVTWLCGQEAAEDPAIAARNANPLPTAALSELRDGQPGWERHAGVGKEIVFPGMPESDGGSGRAELKRIAGVALKYNVALDELTGARRIDLVGLPRDGLPGPWRDFEMPAAFAAADTDRSCRTCIGIDYCRFGQGDSMGLAAKIEGRFRSVDGPGHLMLATAGCPRNCSEAQTCDVGAVAIGDGNWEVYVGGAGGPDLRKGEVLRIANSEDDVLDCMGRFIGLYRDSAPAGESTRAFVQRIGIERIRTIVADAGETATPALDAAMPVVAAQMTIAVSAQGG